MSDDRPTFFEKLRDPKRVLKKALTVAQGKLPGLVSSGNDDHEEKPRPREDFDAVFAAGSDPWDYTNVYESTKYEQTFSLIPDGPIEDALELACAEGHFTPRLAGRVNRLV